MAAPRLPFLWPMLARGWEVTTPSARSARAAQRIHAFHASSPRRRPEVTTPQLQRYGTANEPPPHLAGSKPAAQGEEAGDPSQKVLPKIGAQLQDAGEAEVHAERQEAQKSVGRGVGDTSADTKRGHESADKRGGHDPADKRAGKAAPTTVDGAVQSPAHSDPMPDAAHPVQKRPDAPDTPPEKPLETLLDQVPEPKDYSEDQRAAAKQQQGSNTTRAKELPGTAVSDNAPASKAPHINTPRHVHHFDTYGLVNRLKDGNWSEAQAITTMKGVRVMLAENMDLAREALVSKSQVENETYLFRAACAELKTEVTSRRRAEQENMRTERAQLQHDVEILNQRLGQEVAAMKDDIKGTFDDRKMAVRNDERSMEFKIQRLNYQITVDLQADAKSEVEGLRWVLTRRVILALGAIVVMIVGSLRLHSNAAHEQELHNKRLANMRSGSTQTDSGNGRGRSGRHDMASGDGQASNGGQLLVDSLPTG